MPNPWGKGVPMFEAVIGLEIHCQLATQTKIFCRCPASPPQGESVSEIAPNTYICPTCVGHPGSLPVLNRRVVELAIKAGLATGCTISEKSIFARKNYFYPDLPKGYQISQFELPICVGGQVFIDTQAGEKAVRITRIHMEEDAGKSVHSESGTMVNLNRAGVPLIEIVTEPDLRSAKEASETMRALYDIMVSMGVTHGNLEEGNFRCDANVSVRKKGDTKLGTRTEIKNVNSFKNVEKAVEGEILRQIAVVSSGGKIVQETRLFDADTEQTVVMRTKEDAHDYRYFPDPDLLPVCVTPSMIKGIKDNLPELPRAKAKRWTERLGVSAYDAKVMMEGSSPRAPLVRWFEEASTKNPELAAAIAHHLTGEILRLANMDPSESGGPHAGFTAQTLIDLTLAQNAGKISSGNARKVLTLAWQSGQACDFIIEHNGLAQLSDDAWLEPLVDQVIKDHPDQVEQLKGGKEKVMTFLVGKLMRSSKGKANPEMAQASLSKKILGK